jgi:hypothetical protein
LRNASGKIPEFTSACVIDKIAALCIDRNHMVWIDGTYDRVAVLKGS